MEKKDIYMAVFVLALTLGLAFIVAPDARTTQSTRGECQKTCETRYQACRGQANANQDTCLQAFNTCKARCREIHGNTNTNGNVNSNGNMNSNGNVNSNVNSNGNMNSNGNSNGNMNGNVNRL